MKIIPAIDIIDGKCIRLTKGNYDTQKIYHDDPVEVAKKYESYGIQYLHVVDLDGARSNHIVNHKVLNRIATQTKLKIDFGGGIKSNEDVRKAFENGASQVTGGSVAVVDPELFISWIEKYGNDKIILGADCKDRKITTHGWKSTTDIDVIAFIESYIDKNIKTVICTDIDYDGMLRGCSTDLYRNILSRTNINLIASGGISSMNDIYVVKELGCEGVIVGKAIYEDRISLEELSELC